jgi:hypothetical protein
MEKELLEDINIIIEEEDFRLTNIRNSVFYDLELKKVVKPRGGQERIAWYDAAFGITVEHAIKLVILDRMRKKSGSRYNLDNFLNTYLEESYRLARNIRENNREEL